MMSLLFLPIRVFCLTFRTAWYILTKIAFHWRKCSCKNDYEKLIQDTINKLQTEQERNALQEKMLLKSEAEVEKLTRSLAEVIKAKETMKGNICRLHEEDIQKLNAKHGQEKEELLQKLKKESERSVALDLLLQESKVVAEKNKEAQEQIKIQYEETLKQLKESYKQEKRNAFENKEEEIKSEEERVKDMEEIHARHENELRLLIEKHQQEIKDIKKKQWCHNCENEGRFQCCRNVSYCSEECQKSHWRKEHKRICSRRR